LGGAIKHRPPSQSCPFGPELSTAKRPTNPIPRVALDLPPTRRRVLSAIGGFVWQTVC
jgi:hypothetical protein